MEFFAHAKSRLRAEELQRHIRIDNLPQWCASIDKVLSHEGERGDIYCVWGEFRIRREVIRDGVRFSLPGCINALQWTITADGQEGDVVVHCTINRQAADADFIASLERFASDWKAGVESAVQRIAAEAPQPGCECSMWMA